MTLSINQLVSWAKENEVDLNTPLYLTGVETQYVKPILRNGEVCLEDDWDIYIKALPPPIKPTDGESFWSLDPTLVAMWEKILVKELETPLYMD